MRKLKMEHLKKTFASCKAEKRPALVTYVTAGYPTKEATVDILMGMAVCADVIELGRLSKFSPEY
jgi:tryptophan synthase